MLDSPDAPMPELAYPMIVKPKNEAVSFGLKVVHDESELREAAEVIFDEYQPAGAGRAVHRRAGDQRRAPRQRPARGLPAGAS